MKYNIIALLVTIVGLVALFYKIEYSGWVLFIGLVSLMNCEWSEDVDD